MKENPLMDRKKNIFIQVFFSMQYQSLDERGYRSLHSTFSGQAQAV